MRALVRRWSGRAVAVLVVSGVVVAVAAATHAGPDPLRLALVALLVVAGVGLLTDALPDSTARWRTDVPRPGVRGRDTVVTAHLRVLEDHLTSRHPDAVLRDRLGALADQALRTRYDVSADSEEGRALLGPPLAEVLGSPPRRLSMSTIQACVTRIEQL